MTNPRNPSPASRWSSVLGLVRPAFVLLHLALLPVALLQGSDAGRAEREESVARQHPERVEVARPTHQPA